MRSMPYDWDNDGKYGADIITAKSLPISALASTGLKTSTPEGGATKPGEALPAVLQRHPQAPRPPIPQRVRMALQ
jgi:hypothetical protein